MSRARYAVNMIDDGLAVLSASQPSIDVRKRRFSLIFCRSLGKSVPDLFACFRMQPPPFGGTTGGIESEM